MTREEAIQRLNLLKGSFCVDTETALDMAISALSKPNYETDTEVRLAVVDRHKDKVVLFDAFGEEEYLPKGVLDQIRWERDTALETLEDHGIGLGQRADLLSHEEAWKRIEQTDLISRADALNLSCHLEGRESDNEIIRLCFETYVNHIKALPSAEPTVIRCKDCKMYDPKYTDREYDCPIGLYAVYGNDFCSHAEMAERREP